MGRDVIKNSDQIVCSIFIIILDINQFNPRTISSFHDSMCIDYFYPFVQLFVHSFVHSLIHSFNHSFSHLFSYSFIDAFIHAFIHSRIYTFIHSKFRVDLFSCQMFVALRFFCVQTTQLCHLISNERVKRGGG